MAIKHLKTDEFNAVVEAAPLAVVDFWAVWCGPCQMLAPLMESLEEQYGDKVLVAKVNVDEEPELARQERIEIIPTMVLYRDGYDLGSIVAPDSRARIEEFLTEALA